MPQVMLIRNSMNVLLVIGGLLIATNAMSGEISDKDVQIIGRALGFVEQGPKGDVPVGIVYAPDLAGSKAEADKLAAILGDGLKAGTLTMKPVLVPVTELSKLEGLKVAIMTSGLEKNYDALFQTMRAKQLISVSLDLACVQQVKCVMAVTSDPKVTITVNREAAQAAAVSFGSAFRMMISEL
jgi:hypothetical protein